MTMIFTFSYIYLLIPTLFYYWKEARDIWLGTIFHKYFIQMFKLNSFSDMFMCVWYIHLFLIVDATFLTTVPIWSSFTVFVYVYLTKIFPAAEALQTNRMEHFRSIVQINNIHSKMSLHDC